MTPIKAAAEPSREALLRKAYKALGYSDWHVDDVKNIDSGNRKMVEVTVDACILAFALAAAPAGNAGVSDDMVTAAMRAFELMSSVLRYREKDKWHTCDVMGMRNALKAALSLRQPRESFADEIKRADAAPPEASFYNASDMLGYLNAPREAEPVDACVEGREDLLLIAHEIKEARKAFLDGFGQVGNAARKEKLTQVLWDDAVTIANALEAYASPSPIPEAPGGLDPATIEACAKLIESGAGMADLIDQEELDQQAKYIRALKPQDGGKCEHGIAKVNCGICVPSKMFSKPQDGGRAE